MLVWNTYVGDFNGRRIKAHNVFENTGLLDDCQKNLKKNGEDRAAFTEQLRRDLMYWYWSKCEWEIILQHWPPREDFRDEKIDVYDQVMLNWPVFTDYVWAHRDELKKRRTSK